MANVPFENKIVAAQVGQKIANSGDIEETNDNLFVTQAEKDKIGTSDADVNVRWIDTGIPTGVKDYQDLEGTYVAILQVNDRSSYGAVDLEIGGVDIDTNIQIADGSNKVEYTLTTQDIGNIALNGQNPVQFRLKPQAVEALSQYNGVVAIGIQFGDIIRKLGDLSDVDTSTGLDGNVLGLFGATWSALELRPGATMSSYDDRLEIFDQAGNSFLQIIWNNSGLSKIKTLSASRNDGDIIMAFNMNFEDAQFLNLNASVGATIDGGSTYTIRAREFVLFRYDGSNLNWKYAGKTKFGDAVTSFNYVEDFQAITVPTDKKNIYLRYAFTSGEFDQTIPEISVVGNGTKIYLYNQGDYKISILRDGVDTINGFIDYELLPGSSVELTGNLSDGNWVVANLYNKHIDSIKVKEGTTEIDTTEIEFDTDDFILTDNAGIAEVEFRGLPVSENSANIGQAQILNFDLLNGNLEAVQDGTDPNQINVSCRGINVLGGGLPSQLQTLDLSFNGEDFAVADEAGNALVKLTDKHTAQPGPGFYAGIKQQRSVSDDVSTAETKIKVFFDSTVVDVGKVVTPNPAGQSYTLKYDGVGKTGYIIYVRYSFEGEVGADGNIDLILRNNDTQATITDFQGTPMAVNRPVKAGDKNVVVDSFAYVEITEETEISSWIESDFSGATLRLNDRNNGNSCILVQKVSSEYQTGVPMLQAESDLNISFRYIYASIGEDVRSWDAVLGRTLTERSVLAGSIAWFDSGINLNCLSNLRVQIGTGGFEVRDDGVGLLYSLNTFFSSEETTLLKANALQVDGSIIQTSGPMTLVLAKWTGEPNKQTAQVITGFNVGTQTVEVAPNWVLQTDDAYIIPKDVDAQTVPFTIDAEFAVPADASNIAIVLYLRPENTTFYPTVQKLQSLTFNAIPGSNGLIYAPIRNKSEGDLSQDDTISVFGAGPLNYSDPTFPIGAIDTPIPIGRKVDGNANIVLENWSSQGPATDNLLCNVEGDLSILSSLNVYPADTLTPGQVVTGSFWWATVDAGGAATKIPTSETTFTVTEGQTVPSYIIMKDFTVGVQPGVKLRLYGTVDVPFGAYLKSSNSSQYFSQSRVEIKVFTTTHQKILNNLALDDEDNPKTIISDLDLKLPSGSVSVGDRVIESGARIMNTKSESIGEMGAVLTQQYDGGNYYKAQVVDGTNSSQVVDLQVADDTDNPGVELISINYVTQANAHIQKIAFKPFGGTITKDFTIEFRFDILDSPVYQETVDYTTVTDLGGGVFQYELSHPSLFQTADIIHMTFSDIELLGGNGYDGTDGIRQGDVDYSYFFPYLQFTAIPIVYQNLATEDYVISSLIVPNINCYRSTTLSVTATESVIAFETTISNVGLTLNGSGNLVVTESGIYKGLLDFYFNESTNTDLLIWIEKKPVSTGVWELYQGTLNKFYFRNATGSSINFSSGLSFISGDEIRFKILATTGSGTLETINETVDLGSISQYAASLQFFRIDF